MFASKNVRFGSLLIVWSAVSQAHGSQDTIGPNGINSAGLTTANGLPLNGGAVGSVDPVAIGQVETFRPGDPGFDTNATLFNATVNPAGVFFVKQGPPITFNATANVESEIGQPPYPLQSQSGQHAVGVAGVMISTAMDSPNTPNTPTGVATGARLYSSGVELAATVDESYASLALQQIALLPGLGVDVRAINMSFLVDPATGTTDGNTLITLFVDWSARVHDVLYVATGTETIPNVNTDAFTAPSDNFNGITVAFSSKVGGSGKFVQVAGGNRFDLDAEGTRTSIDILAPGQDIDVVGRGTSRPTAVGTSFAAPHVTGTVALLQQYANERIANGGWDAVRSRRHETMKAILLNSANKIADDGNRTVNGIHVPVGGFLGMDRTVVNQDGDDWLESDAFLDNEPDSFDNGLLALDEQMGAGHLDAKRAVQQFAPGEFNNTGTATVPVIGWDYGSTPAIDAEMKYRFAQPLAAGSFVSITLAFDRKVEFETDGGTQNQFDYGDTFAESTTFVPGQDQTNDLDLFLLPFGATDTDDAIALSQSSSETLEHLFAQIPSSGMYEFWVRQYDDDLGDGQDYAVAWWAMAAATGTSQGDYDGNGTIQANDYNVWKSNFGTANAAADGNGNGIVDAADYTIWRDHLGQMVGTGGVAAVPEPNAGAALLLVGIAVIMCRPNALRVG